MAKLQIFWPIEWVADNEITYSYWLMQFTNLFLLADTKYYVIVNDVV